MSITCLPAGETKETQSAIQLWCFKHQCPRLNKGKRPLLVESEKSSTVTPTELINKLLPETHKALIDILLDLIETGITFILVNSAFLKGCESGANQFQWIKSVKFQQF